MPRITGCRTHVVVRVSERPQWNPRTTWREKRVVLVFVDLDDGTTGVGEAYCDGGVADSVIAIVERDLAPLVVGGQALAIRRQWHAMIDTSIVSAKAGACHAAASGIDIALWDAVGKHLGKPVHRLLGAARDRVFAYASAGLYGPGKTPDDLAAEMAGYVAQGFRGVKLKVGGASIDEDVERVRVVREAIGPQVRLMVDALYAYDAVDALRLARRIADHDVHFLEAPVHPDDFDGLARVCRDSPIPVAGNEFAYTADAYRRLIGAGVSIVHADAILCGGITGALRIADLADAFHRPISFHAASSAVCLAANAQVALAVRNAESVEFHMLHRLLHEQAQPLPFAIEHGHLVLSDAPGLGLPLGDIPGASPSRPDA